MTKPTTSPIKFTKMHGLGNDFVVIDAVNQAITIQDLSISQLANRHTGIGCDQVLIITTSKTADFACLIFNADGSEAEQCGNGMRCVGRYIHEYNLSNKKSITVATKATIVTIDIKDYDNIRVAMGIPNFTPAEIPFITDKVDMKYTLELAHQAKTVELAVVSMGNPHAVVQVDSVQDFPVNELGQEIALHHAFPAGANVGFMEILSPSHVRLRTFERGSGETLACGSNACAAIVTGIRQQILNSKVQVELPLGSLWIEWEGENQPVMMTGPAVRVFEGQYTSTR